MKILIEESVLRQAIATLEFQKTCFSTCADCNRKGEKAITALRTALDAAEKVEPVAWMITTDNTNLHPLDPNRESNWLAFDVNQFRNDSARALVISDTQPLYLHPALDAAERDELVDVLRQALEFVEYHSNKWNGTGVHPMSIVTALRTALDAAAQDTQRITELESVIKSHGIPVKTYSGGVAHYCMKEEE